jgi:hypothetical protein
MLLEVQDFVNNRLRAVARDFTSQNYRENGRNDALALEAHERMVRGGEIKGEGGGVLS